MHEAYTHSFSDSLQAIPMRTATTRIIAATLFTLMLAGSMQLAHAQIELGPRIGYDLEVEELHIGAEARFDLPGVDLPIKIKPSVDYYLVDNFTLMTFDANGIYEIDLEGGTIHPYVGAGLGILYWSFDTEFAGFGDASTTNVGLNLLGGAAFGSGSLRPFAEARFNTDDLFTLTGGVLFQLGQ